MEMEMELGPPAAAGAAIEEAKRARKRSRYLSPPYTDDDDAEVLQLQQLQVVKDDDDGGKEEPPLNVCAADVLSALRDAALLSLDPNAAQALRFIALFRTKKRTSTSIRIREEETESPTICSSCQCQEEENAPALDEKRADANFAVNAANGAATSAPRNPKRRKKMINSSSRSGQKHFKNPVALVLDFAQGEGATPPLPSRDDLVSTFRRFGSVIHSETGILQDQRSARVVFATRAEAEAAYACAGTLGHPFTCLQDLPPITLTAASPPVPKLPLKDVRNNLEKMILSLTSRSDSFKDASPQQAKHLVGEMQGLLAKIVFQKMHDNIRIRIYQNLA
ncbi:hypothetical protein PR202_gb25286 [Eleusine coracana subsp. coracana]|uniref:RRM domain-containing protein n=1 Tax=Eleusine coracana subsp. coracana TaxID=191504 RepID=A0AAV5FNS1_ELECO|nr:hypothetical protein PR202_gb25286 [Eleusine coracana subsp. coracana]